MRKLLLLAIAFCFMCGMAHAQNLDIIESELQEILNQKSDDMISVTIMFKSQIKTEALKAKAGRSNDKSVKREIVVSELKDFASSQQSDVMSILQAEAKSGKVADINSLWIVNAISCKATREVIYMLSSHPDIAMMSYNKEMQLLEKEEMEDVEEIDMKGGNNGSAPYRVNANNVWWGEGYTGKNVVIAVLDSGTNFYHHAIRNNLWTAEKDGETIHGWNFTTNDEAGNSNILDEFGHGTHCAGIVCGSNEIGVAPDARLMTVKIVGRTGTGSVIQMLRGVQFAVDNGADVLSMSLGFKTKQLKDGEKETIRKAFDNVLEAGVVVCAAAGNDGNNDGAPDNVDYPAACPSPWSNPDQTLKGGLSSVICVGANDLSASSQGPSTWENTSYNDYPYNKGAEMGLIRPDISAPGNLIYSLNHNNVNKYKLMSGTSQSTPSVAGVIALMLEKNPNLTPAQICEILETTAVNKPAKKNNVVGSGRVDAVNAVKAVTAQNQKAFFKIAAFTPNVATQGNSMNLVIKMRNNGKGISSVATSLLLETSSPYISFNTTTATLGAVTPGNTVEVPFTVNVNEDTPNNHCAYFTVTTTDGTYSWKENFSINVSSISDLTYISVDPNIININETVDINVSMKNIGSGPMNGNTTLKLLTLSDELEHVTLIDDEATLGPIGAGETAVGTFTIKAHNDAVTHNYPIDLFLQINSSTQSSYFDIVYEFENDMEGWTTFDADDNYKEIYNPYFHSNESFAHMKNPRNSHSGTGHIMSETMPFTHNEQPTPIDNYFVSPKVKVTANSKFSFWARAHHANYYAEHFGVAISTNSNNKADDFTTLKEWDIKQQQGTEWKQYTIDLSSYAGKEIYVAIRHFFTQEQWEILYNGYYVEALNIDDVIISDVAIDFNYTPTYSNSDKTYFNVKISNPLPKVTGLAATANGVDEIALTWDRIERAQSYNIYRDNMLIANTEKASYTDKGLTHNTEFCYEVAAVGSSFTFERSEKVYATTYQKEYSATITEFSPETIYIDGETSVNMNLTVLNDGVKEFKTKAYYTLKCDDNTNVTINNTTTDYIKILQPNESVCKTISVKLTDQIANNSVIRFNLNITSMSNQSNEYFTFDIPFEVIVKNDPNSPKKLEVTDKTDNTVTLSWEANANANALGYYIYRDGEYIGHTSSTTYFDNNGLQASTNYRYEVTSLMMTGESDMSEPLYVTTALANNSVKLQSINISNTIGEATLTATFVNKGSEATPEATTATLICDDEYVTIDNDNAIVNLGSIAVDGTATAEFSITISDNVPANHNIDFNAVIEYKGEVLKNLEYNFDTDFEGWLAVNYDGYLYSGKPHTWYHYSEKDLHAPNEPKPYDGGYIVNATYCNTSGHSHTTKAVDDIILLPEKIKIKSDTEISFYVRSTATSTNYCKEHYGVTVTQELLNYGHESKYTNVWEETLSAPGWKETTYNFKDTDYIGEEYYIGIRHFNCNGNSADGLCIDKLKIANVIIAGNLTIDNSFSVTANPSVNIFNGTGAWDIASNWSKSAVPSASDNVIISGNATIENGDITVNTLLIYSGSLTVEDGVNLTITDELSNTNANAFIINDGAQLFQNNDNVAATFIKNIRNPKSWDANHTEGWQFIASPVNNAYVLSFIPQTETDYDLFKYDGTKEMQWVNYKGHSNEFDKTFQLGTAYLASYEAETTTSFSGILNNESSFNFDVTYDSDDSWANFHLLGNPFTFNMDWNNVTLNNVYDGYAKINPSDGSYMTYTRSEDEGIIAAGEGFFVEAIGVNPTLTYGTQSKSRGEEKADYINVIASGKQGSSNLIVRLDGEEETGFSKLENINPTIADIYVVKNSRRYSILGYDENTTEVELFFDAKEMGTYSISLDVNGKFQSVTLVDRMTGIETNMLLEDEYAFVASSSDNPNRFFLRLDNSQQSTDNSHFAYVNNGDIVIYDIEGNAQINIFDAMGRCLYQGESTDAINRVPTGGFSAGVYVIQKVDENGVNVQKIILE